MSIESETLPMLYLGFFLIIVSILFVIIKLWLESKDISYIWFIAQLIFLLLSFFKFIDFIKPNPGIPASFLSEENSLSLGIIGILWATSMVCMVIGILSISHKHNK